MAALELAPEPKRARLGGAAAEAATVDVNTPGAFASAHFSRGKDTYAVPMAMHAENRARLRAAMHAAGHTEGTVLLQGGGERTRYDTDYEGVFRQESVRSGFGVSATTSDNITATTARRH